MIIWIELWRTLNANILQYLSSIENIISRLDSRKNSTEWSYKQVDRCSKLAKEVEV